MHLVIAPYAVNRRLRVDCQEPQFVQFREVLGDDTGFG
jgi:hypothetical protein